MENNCTAYIEIRFSYSPSYIYQECLGLVKRMPNFIPSGNNSSCCNCLVYTYEQIKVYDPYFELLMERVFKLSSTKIYYKGIEVDRILLNNLRWQHRQKKPQPYGKPIGIYEEFFRKD